MTPPRRTASMLSSVTPASTSEKPRQSRILQAGWKAVKDKLQDSQTDGFGMRDGHVSFATATDPEFIGNRLQTECFDIDDPLEISSIDVREGKSSYDGKPYKSVKISFTNEDSTATDEVNKVIEGIGTAHLTVLENGAKKKGVEQNERAILDFIKASATTAIAGNDPRRGYTTIIARKNDLHAPRGSIQILSDQSETLTPDWQLYSNDIRELDRGDKVQLMKCRLRYYYNSKNGRWGTTLYLGNAIRLCSRATRDELDEVEFNR